MTDVLPAQRAFAPLRGTRLGPKASDSLVCPTCRVSLVDAGRSLACTDCGSSYGITGGQVDLRPQHTSRVEVEFEVGTRPPNPFLDRVGPLRVRSGASHDPDVIAWGFAETHGSRMTRALFTHLPDRPVEGGILLDLGCGPASVYGRLLRSTGFEYVGLDVESDGPEILGDAHRLPFRDGSMDAVVAISVLEHLRTPAVAMAEIRRVLRPGGVLIGSVALVEPFHMQSYLHHTHLGTLDALADAGFEVQIVSPTEDWGGLQAYAEMALFPGFWRASWLAAKPIVLAVLAVSWLWWRVIGRTRRLPAAEAYRTLLLASGFRFVARRPADQA